MITSVMYDDGRLRPHQGRETVTVARSTTSACPPSLTTSGHHHPAMESSGAGRRSPWSPPLCSPLTRASDHRGCLSVPGACRGQCNFSLLQKETVHVPPRPRGPSRDPTLPPVTGEGPEGSKTEGRLPPQRSGRSSLPGVEHGHLGTITCQLRMPPVPTHTEGRLQQVV